MINTSFAYTTLATNDAGRCGCEKICAVLNPTRYRRLGEMRVAAEILRWIYFQIHTDTERVHVDICSRGQNACRMIFSYFAGDQVVLGVTNILLLHCVTQGIGLKASTFLKSNSVLPILQAAMNSIILLIL